VVPAAQTVRRGQHFSSPHAVAARLYQYVAGSAHVVHVVPSAHTVPAGDGGSVPHAVKPFPSQYDAGFLQKLQVPPRPVLPAVAAAPRSEGVAGLVAAAMAREQGRALFPVGKAGACRRRAKVLPLRLGALLLQLPPLDEAWIEKRSDEKSEDVGRKPRDCKRCWMM
jgi:hypothetical protein